MLQAVTGPISLGSVCIACIKFAIQQSAPADILYRVAPVCAKHSFVVYYKKCISPNKSLSTIPEGF